MLLTGAYSAWIPAYAGMTWKMVFLKKVRYRNMKMKHVLQKLYIGLQLLGICSFLSSTMLQAKSDATKSQAKKYVIGAHQGGLLAAFMAVLNHLAYCKQTGRTPVVYWN